METLLLSPNGYCSGVKGALSLARKAKRDHPDQDIWLLGMIVHNETTVSALLDEGFHLIDERNENLQEALSHIPEGDVVVFSAHGHPFVYDEIAKARHLVVIDATCPFVTGNLLSASSSPLPIVYVGTKGHLEAEAFLHNCAHVVAFVDASKMELRVLKDIPKESETLVITQTTLSLSERDEALNALILPSYPKATLGKERCRQTMLRQEAVLSLPSDIDVLIVLGSKTSNNSRKLDELGASKGIESHLCLGLEEVKLLDLSHKKKVALTSGASTDPATIDEVYAYLISL